MSRTSATIAVVTRPRWMLTAFEPFGGRAHNFSAMVLDRVRDTRIGTRLLPVAFDALAGDIAAVLDTRPDVLVLMGETRARRRVFVERVALNILDAGGRPDNRGAQPAERPVIAGEPLALAATWNADRVVHALGMRGVPAAKSYHAGSYACNQALYLALSGARERGLDTTIGFLHVPGGGVLLASKARQLARCLPEVFAVAPAPVTEVNP